MFQGTGDLTVFVDVLGENVVCSASVTLELHDIEWFYDIYTNGVTSGTRWEVEVETAATHSQTAGYQSETDEKLLFVHGWNMQGWEKRRWAETMFKRLWWQGYKGSVALFDWPTMDGFTGSWWWDLLVDSRHFDNSEYIAWRSADALAGLMGTLNSGGNLSVLAHSMGNVVMGEALKK
jgi:esterase/lipase superfamily enzyme